ncbi:hypothetical protein DRO49_06480, partial [Candidatus Bathyarchaeota archaeon]
NARGGDIHANGNITFDEYTNISNINSLSTAGEFKLAYTPFVKAQDYNNDEIQNPTNAVPLQRFPYYEPNNGRQANWSHEDYTNNPDGHYAGDLYGLYMIDAGHETTRFVKWDPDLGSPINPWPGIEGISAPNGYSWDNTIYPGYENVNIYQQRLDNEGAISCGLFETCATIDGISGNEHFNEANVKINDVYIPNRMGDFHYVEKFAGGYDEYVETNITDSGQNPNEWRNFLNSYQKTVTTDVYEDDTITGLSDVLMDKNSGTSILAPPNINTQAIIDKVKGGEEGLIFEIVQTDDGEFIEVRKGQAILTSTTEGGSGSANIFPFNPTEASTPISAQDIGCGSNGILFEKKAYMNHLTGQREQTIRVDLGLLQECGLAPANGLIVVDAKGTERNPMDPNTYRDVHVGLSVFNAETIPTDGLTYVVHGNLILEGHYNYDASADDEQAALTSYQPSAAIVSDEVYLVSKEFARYGYPTTLPVSQHHSNYPYEGIYSSGQYTLPEGTGFESDWVEGYNWLEEYAPPNLTTITNGYEGGAMPNFVGQTSAGNMVDHDGDGKPEYRYNISLIGQSAWDPKFLELWNYYADPSAHEGEGDGGPANWQEREAIVRGSFIQLSGQFPSTKRFQINDRSCNQLNDANIINPIVCLDIEDPDVCRRFYIDKTIPCRD